MDADSKSIIHPYIALLHQVVVADIIPHPGVPPPSTDARPNLKCQYSSNLDLRLLRCKIIDMRIGERCQRETKTTIIELEDLEWGNHVCLAVIQCFVWSFSVSWDHPLLARNLVDTKPNS